HRHFHSFVWSFLTTPVAGAPTCCQLSSEGRHSRPALRHSTQSVSLLKDHATVFAVSRKGFGAFPAFCSSRQVEHGTPVMCSRSGSRTARSGRLSLITVAFKGEVASVLATSLPCLGLLLMDRVGDGAYAQRSSGSV